jgi:uncharacterized membrane protein YesL
MKSAMTKVIKNGPRYDFNMYLWSLFMENFKTSYKDRETVGDANIKKANLA